MLIGYMRVSKADGSQVVDLQRDALLAVGVDIVRLYEDHASRHIDDRPGLDACLKSLRAATHPATRDYKGANRERSLHLPPLGYSSHRSALSGAGGSEAERGVGRMVLWC